MDAVILQVVVVGDVELLERMPPVNGQIDVVGRVVGDTQSGAVNRLAIPWPLGVPAGSVVEKRDQVNQRLAVAILVDRDAQFRRDEHRVVPDQLVFAITTDGVHAAEAELLHRDHALVSVLVHQLHDEQRVVARHRLHPRRLREPSEVIPVELRRHDWVEFVEPKTQRCAGGDHPLLRPVNVLRANTQRGDARLPVYRPRRD